VEGESLSIIDASVVLKWFITEEQSNKAKKLQDDYIAGKIAQ
jgi:predicted nucleic acid-binding protein